MDKYGTAGLATDDNIIRRMRFACWIAKATDIHSEYVILIAFVLQRWLHENNLILRYTYIACVANFKGRVCWNMLFEAFTFFVRHLSAGGNLTGNKHIMC